eukprot:Hpha_TRINITY_DN19869_c0_g1::TRINITY_DN19869_c0_g1_i1::g.132092::m.132092/K16317/trmY; tRNA (pseudouridine54-N1)-methyltransferase
MWLRRFVLICRSDASWELSNKFSLSDLDKHRMDMKCRCIVAGLMFSHGVRRDTTVRIVHPRQGITLRADGWAAVGGLRPAERTIASRILLLLGGEPETKGARKRLRRRQSMPWVAREGEAEEDSLLAKTGLSLVEGGVQEELREGAGTRQYVLTESGVDIGGALDTLQVGQPATFYIGDDAGFGSEDLRLLKEA